MLVSKVSKLPTLLLGLSTFPSGWLFLAILIMTSKTRWRSLILIPICCRSRARPLPIPLLSGVKPSLWWMITPTSGLGRITPTFETEFFLHIFWGLSCLEFPLYSLSEMPVCSYFHLFAIFGVFVRNVGWVFAILFEVFLIECQEEIHHFAGWERGLKGHKKFVNKTFVNKLAFP